MAMSMKIRDYLSNMYQDVALKEGDPDTFQKLVRMSRMIRYASQNGLAVGGSMGLHLGHRDPRKLPGDIDFVTKSVVNAMEFLQFITCGIVDYAHHETIYVQNKTDWCPPGVITHIKIQSTLVMPVCIMVLAHDRPLNIWYNEVGVCVQKYNDICDAARELQERDNKKRDLDKPMASQPVRGSWEYEEEDEEDFDAPRSGAWPWRVIPTKEPYCR